jgi:hypothetical protein
MLGSSTLLFGGLLRTLALAPVGAPVTLGLDFGIGVEHSATGAAQPIGEVAAVAGLDLQPDFGEPVRIELALGSGTRGPPWWRGVRAVSVRAWIVDLTAAAGWSVPFWSTSDGLFAVGLDLLAGATLRITGVATRISERIYLAHEASAVGRLLAGPFARLDVWRVQMRVVWLFPNAPSVLLGVAYRL